MKNFKKLLNEKGQIWLSVNEKNKLDFFNFVKNLGCVWIDGKDINPTKDKCGYHMGISNNLKIGYVASICWVANKNNDPIKIDFNDVYNSCDDCNEISLS